MQVVDMNDYQKTRFVNRMISSMFNTIRNKDIAMLGFAFKKDTGDTRETPALDVAKGLLAESARVRIYDPEVSEAQIRNDLSLDKFEWDQPGGGRAPGKPEHKDSVTISKSAIECVTGVHAVAIVTEWDEFKTLDWKAIYDTMQKPAFVFDGRNILDGAKMREIGFIVYSLGKPLDPFLAAGAE